MDLAWLTLKATPPTALLLFRNLDFYFYCRWFCLLRRFAARVLLLETGCEMRAVVYAWRRPTVLHANTSFHENVRASTV